VGSTYSCWMLNCWCITWPVGLERLNPFFLRGFEDFYSACVKDVFCFPLQEFHIIFIYCTPICMQHFVTLNSPLNSSNSQKHRSLYIMKHIILYVLAVLSNACGTWGLEQMCLQDFGEESVGQTHLRRPGLRWEVYIETNVLEMWWGGINWIDDA